MLRGESEAFCPENGITFKWYKIKENSAQSEHSTVREDPTFFTLLMCGWHFIKLCRVKDWHISWFITAFKAIYLPFDRDVNKETCCGWRWIIILPDMFQVDMLTWSQFVKIVYITLNISSQQIKTIKSMCIEWGNVSKLSYFMFTWNFWLLMR